MKEGQGRREVRGMMVRGITLAPPSSVPQADIPLTSGSLER